MKKFTLRFTLLALAIAGYSYNSNAQCVYTVAGGGACYKCSGGPGTGLLLDNVYSTAVDDSGNVYFGTTTAIVYKLNKTNTNSSFVAGTGFGGFSGDGGPATSAKISSGPAGIAIDDSGNVFIADMYNNRVREVRAKTGIINTIAGTGTAGYSGDGGPATSAKIKSPASIAVDDSGNVYIADQGNNRIRKIYAVNHKIVTITGNGTAGFGGDGTNALANGIINSPYGVAVDSAYNVYISDFGNNRVREIMKSSGIINTIAGNGTAGHSGDGSLGMLAEIRTPIGITVDKNLNVFFIEQSSNDVRRIDASSGNISTVAGSYTLGNGFNGDGMAADTTQFYLPYGIAVDASDNIYISDLNNDRLRKVSSSGPSAPSPSDIGSICSGDSVYVQVESGAILGWYTAPTGGTYLGSANPLNTHALATTTTFYAQDSSWCGVSARTAITVPVNPSPTVTITGKTTICQGMNDTLIANITSGTAPFTYSWSPFGNKTDTVIYNNGLTYTVNVNDAEGCAASASITVTVDSASITTSNDTAKVTLGCGSSIQLKAITHPSVSSIAWSPSTYLSNTNIANPQCTMTGTASVNYMITATLTDGCVVHDSLKVMSKGANRLDSVRICIVTVDTASAHNILTWDNTGNTDIDSLKLYYLNSSSVWELIHAQLFSGPSSYTDTLSINNPNANTVRYCLAGVDSCGNQEPFPACIWQNTTHIIQSPPGTFSWSGTGYLIKNVGQPILTYVLYRDSISNGNWKAIDSVSGTQNTMTDVNYSSYPNARWRVDGRLDTTLHKTCVAPLELKGGPSHAANTSTSRSNQQHNITFTGVNNVAATSKVSLYPNPVSQTVNIKFDNNNKAAEATIKVTDMTGRVIMEEANQSISNNLITLNVAGLPSGVYFVEVSRNASVQVVKFVKE